MKFMLERSFSLFERNQFSKSYSISSAKVFKGFLADGKLIRQVDGCIMGGPISVVLSNIFCV